MEKLLLIENVFPIEILSELRKVGDILQRHGAQKIILYGSLARGDYKADSDMDLCVEGMSDREYFRAFAECLMLTQRRVSVLDLAQLRGYIRERVLTEGKILYEQN